jgi:putative transposase
MTQFVDEHRDVYGVEPICHALAFATSTYYAIRQRHAAPSERALRDVELLVEIRRIHEHSDGT